MEQLTTEQQYELVKKTIISWVNWNTTTDLVGLLMGLGDYMLELNLIEKELGLPKSSILDYKKW